MTALAHRAPIAPPRSPRLTAVELRKMTDTRAGLWLLIAVALGALAAVVITLVAGEDTEHTLDRFFLVSGVAPSTPPAGRRHPRRHRRVDTTHGAHHLHARARARPRDRRQADRGLRARAGRGGRLPARGRRRQPDRRRPVGPRRRTRSRRDGLPADHHAGRPCARAPADELGTGDRHLLRGADRGRDPRPDGPRARGAVAVVRPRPGHRTTGRRLDGRRATGRGSRSPSRSGSGCHSPPASCGSAAGS